MGQKKTEHQEKAPWRFSIAMYEDPNAQPPYGQPQQPYISPYEQQYTQQPYPSTQYGGPPPYGAPPNEQPIYVIQQPKQSYKTVWIVLGVVLGLILLVGGGCCAALSFGVLRGTQLVNSTFQSINATATVDAQTAIASELPPQQQAQDYYSMIGDQDYTSAYADLSDQFKLSDGTTLTERQFTAQAKARDTTDGLVTQATATADPNDPSQVTVQVTRANGKTYTVHLTFVQGTFEWDISSFDTI